MIEGLELISDIDFEHSRPFKNDLGHPRIICTDGLKSVQVKIFVPVDVSMDLNTNISTYFEMINLKIFGRALFAILLSAHFCSKAVLLHYHQRKYIIYINVLHIHKFKICSVVIKKKYYI